MRGVVGAARRCQERWREGQWPYRQDGRAGRGQRARGGQYGRILQAYTLAQNSCIRRTLFMVYAVHELAVSRLMTSLAPPSGIYDQLTSLTHT